MSITYKDKCVHLSFLQFPHHLPAMKSLPLLSIIALALFCISLIPATATPSSLSSLSKGSSLSVEDILVSPDNSFTCGFYEVGTNAYAFSIWFSDSADNTIAWTANRDRPVNGHGSKITFQSDGSIALVDADDTVVWSTDTNSTEAEQLQLLDTGNLVAKDAGGKILWQSFDSPTDTLLATQPITKNIKLLSATAKGSLTSGYYTFYFDNDNVLRLLYDGSEISSIYWPNPDNNVFQNGRTDYNSSRYGVLDEEGQFVASDLLAFNASDMGPGIMRRLTLDYDGNLRLYSLMQSTGAWSVTWAALTRICDVHGLCGRNGVCLYTQSVPSCSCPLGFEMSDPTDWSKGCKSKLNMSCENPDQLKFVELPQSDFWGYDLNYTQSVSFEDCKSRCETDCSCIGIEYKMGSGYCYTKNVLFNGRSSPDNPGNIYLKLSRGIKTTGDSVFELHEPTCNASESEPTLSSSELYDHSDSKTKWEYFYWFLLAFGWVEVLFIASGWWFVFRREQKPTLLEEGYRVMSSHFRKFTYKELKRATRNFRDELGRGGSGTVYKGVLDDDRVVAVKKLVDVIQGEEEFWAEVSVIGRINHMNLVRMYGFCSEGSKKLLVYEYVQNGSLDKRLFDPDKTTGSFSWDDRYTIAIGVAKALAYLHHECLEWIIHCDVKPENILLDSDLKPKLADFGLAKLSKRGGVGSRISHIRGTRGYMAPEWTSNLPITAKIDVYSYGVVLLEMVTGRRISNWMMDGEEATNMDTGLVRMIKTKLGNGDMSWIGDIVDATLEGRFDRRRALVMVEIAIDCLEEERSKRPTMDAVAQLLLENQFSSPLTIGSSSSGDQ